MNNHEDYSDEFLNAYIDGELDKSEAGALLEELRYNKELSKRVTDLQKIREMVRYAYQDIPVQLQPESAKQRSVFRNRKFFAAAAVMLVGIAVGWNLHQYRQPANGLLDFASSMQVKAVNDNHMNIVLHVTTDDERKLNTVLNQTEILLDKYQHEKQQVKLDILTNAKGLKLLHAKHSPFNKRISALQERFDNLTFKACKVAIERAEKRLGEKIDMLPETVVVPSALSEIMEKQHDGWSYIKI